MLAWNLSHFSSLCLESVRSAHCNVGCKRTIQSNCLKFCSKWLTKLTLHPLEKTEGPRTKLGGEAAKVIFLEHPYF